MIANTKARWMAMPFCLLLTATAVQGAILTRLNQGDSLTIVAIGTSLTHAGHSSWFASMGAWLNAQYPDKVTLYNEAVSGSASKYNSTYTIANYPNKFSGLDVQLKKALEHNPDAVFIEFAMNDAYTPYAISPQDSKDNLLTMISQINDWALDNDKYVDIVIQTTNNCIDKPADGTSFATQRPVLSQYYENYRDVARTNTGVLLIDHYDNWLKLYNSQPDHATWNSYVPDGLHPNDLGAENVIVPEIKKALNSQVPEPSAMVSTVTALLGLLCCRRWRRARSATANADCGNVSRAACHEIIASSVRCQIR